MGIIKMKIKTKINDIKKIESKHFLKILKTGLINIQII